MKTRYMILSAASIIPLLSSCASYQKTAENQVWSIKPVYSAQHSTETPESFYQLGRYYQGQNRYVQALTAFQKALAIDATYAEARNGIGVIYATQGRQQEAIEQFRLAVQHAPNAAHIYNNLGYALYLNGAYAEAVSALDRAVALSPANRAAHTNLALALNKAGEREKAVQVMAQAAKPPSAVNAPAAAHESSQAQSTPLPPVAVVPAVAATTPAPAPQPELALPKDWGVITPAGRKPVPQVEGHIQTVQLAPNVYELRERTDVKVASVAPSVTVQAKPVQPAKPVPALAQVSQQPVAAVESRVPAVAKTSGATDPVRQAQAGKPYSIEVSNGNGVTGMARKVAGYLDKEGYRGAHLTNLKPFNVTASHVQYRSGYREQAQLLASALPGQPGIAQSDNLRRDVRVVLGKDLTGNMAQFEQSQDKIRLARN